MLNRIRRAVSLTRVRHFPKGRHRRPTAPAPPPVAPACTAPADKSTVVLRWALDHAGHRHPLRGEDIALVRPYVLAREKRGQQSQSTVAGAPHLPSEVWSVLLGAC